MRRRVRRPRGKQNWGRVVWGGNGGRMGVLVVGVVVGGADDHARSDDTEEGALVHVHPRNLPTDLLDLRCCDGSEARGTSRLARELAAGLTRDAYRVAVALVMTAGSERAERPW